MSKFPDWLEGARAAPSRYNSQPWHFRVRSDGDIEVRWNAARSLPASDPTGRDLFLALGAAIESACLKSAATGTPLVFEPATEQNGSSVGLLVPKGTSAAREDKRLAGYLGERHTSRTPHLRFSIPPVVQLALRRETVGWGCRLYIESERVAVRRLATLVRRAAIERYRDPEIRAEMRAWYRLTPADLENCEDGVTAECLDVHGFMLSLTRRALAPNSDALTRWGAGEILAFRDWNIARHTGAFCLLTTQSTDRVDMVRAGRLLMRLWLLAAEAGLSTHAVSQILQSPALSDPCLRLFGAEGAIPACLFRLGFSPPGAASPRMPPAQLLLEAERSPVESGIDVSR